VGITHNVDEILPFQRVQNTIGCDMFKPLQDELLLAMIQHHLNVIYLNPDRQPHPRDTLAIQSARLHEEYGDRDEDLRPLLVYFPVDTDKRYLGAVGPNATSHRHKMALSSSTVSLIARGCCQCSLIIIVASNTIIIIWTTTTLQLSTH
jgi:hypothetical protein